MQSSHRYSIMVENIVQRIKPPCIGCTDRVSGCHGRCEGYKNYRAELEATKAKVYESLKPEIKVEDYEIKKYAKRKR